MAERRRAVSPDETRPGPLPDAFLPRLYHKHVGPEDYDLLYGPARAEALAALARPFRYLLIDMSGGDPAIALAVAPLCTCTVLVVEAGVTPLAAIRDTLASMAISGGRVVGTVLTAAPRKHRATLSP
jgi:Mrp family chromosome partitioning ATPase